MTLLPVFIDHESTYGTRRAVGPDEALEAIISHCLLIDDDLNPELLGLALKMFAAQCLAYAQGKEDLMAGSPYYRAQSENERNARTLAGLLASLRNITEPAAVQNRADDDREQRRAQDSRQETHGEDSAAA